MFNFNSTRTAIAAMLAFASIGANAKVASEEVVHITASAITKQFGVENLSVPKVFVLSNDGVLQYESKANSTPDDVAIYESILDTSPNAGDKHVVATVLAGVGVDVTAANATGSGGNLVVSLETGKSIGICPGCENYYPEFRQRLENTKMDIRWIRITIEKNEYQAEKSKTN